MAWEVALGSGAPQGRVRSDDCQTILLEPRPQKGSQTRGRVSGPGGKTDLDAETWVSAGRRAVARGLRWARLPVPRGPSWRPLAPVGHAGASPARHRRHRAT